VTIGWRRAKLVARTAFNRVHPLTTDERTALLQGTKAKAGFSVRRSHILLLSDEGRTPHQLRRRVFHALSAKFVAALSQPHLC
jgi:hypothetical protein